MSITLDHLFVSVSPGAPEAMKLREFGLTEGEPNRHPGQGTANRRFFFRNAMLELLWVDDAAKVQSDPARRTRLWERWSGRHRDASPFGVCARSGADKHAQRPFPSWEYRPPYLPDPLVIHVANDAPLWEPMWFYIGFGRRPDAELPKRRQPLDHASGFREITAVLLRYPRSRQLSVAAQTLVQRQVVALALGEEHLLELEFDRGQQGRSADFRPDLPMVFRW